MQSKLISKHKCIYCYWWIHSPTIQKKSEGSTKIYSRQCPNRKKLINTDSLSCKYFDPRTFWCNKNNMWIDIIACLARRRNIPELQNWDRCKKCMQYDKEIKEIVKDYWLNAKPIIKPGKTKPTKIKRRKKEVKVILKRRKTKSSKIKRRKKEEVKVIKRRKTKPNKIKRRKNGTQ